MLIDTRFSLLLLAITAFSVEAEAQLSELPFGNPELPAGDGPRRLALGDLDGDGDRDVVTALAGTIDPITGFADGTTTGVLLANGDGTFEAPFELPAGLGPREVAVVDLDGDGHLDVVSM